MKDDTCIVDFERFKVESGLDDDTVKELYCGFLEEILEEKDKLLAQIAQKEYDKLAKTVHNLKGVSSSYMANYIYVRSLNLDMRLKSNGIENIDEIVDKLVNDITKTAEEIINHYML